MKRWHDVCKRERKSKKMIVVCTNHNGMFLKVSVSSACVLCTNVYTMWLAGIKLVIPCRSASFRRNRNWNHITQTHDIAVKWTKEKRTTNIMRAFQRNCAEWEIKTHLERKSKRYLNYFFFFCKINSFSFQPDFIHNGS